jgi:transcription elongation GreA/GreB family factor
MIEHIEAGRSDELESAWMAAAEADAIAPDDAAAVLSRLVEADREEAAETLGWALLAECKEHAPPDRLLALSKAAATAVPVSAELRQEAVAAYRRLRGSHEHFDALVKASDVLSAQTPRRAFATLDLCLRVHDGDYLANRFQNRVVQVRRYDPTMNEYELEDLTAGRVTLEPRRLADEFEQVDETDFRILSRRDPERLAAVFQADPAGVLVGICQAHDGRIDSTSLRELLVPRYLARDQWSRWWTKARAAAKRCERLSLEGKNPITILYHPEGRTLEQEFAGGLEAARTPLEYLDVLRRYLREAKQRRAKTDEAFVGGIVAALADQARSFLATRPADALAAALALDRAAHLGAGDRPPGVPAADEVLAAAPRPAEAVAALAGAPLWAAALEALCRRDDRPDQLERLLGITPARQLDDVARALHEAGRADAVTQAASQTLADPLGHLELCLWLWAGSDETPKDIASKLEILTRLLKCLQDIDIDLEADVENPRELQRQIRGALAASHYAGFREVVAGLDEAMASILKGRIERTSGLAATVHDTLLNILRENFYQLFAPKAVEPWLDENTLWTTRRALDRCEAELKELVEVKIPTNSRAIGAAAAHGDLSENSEWKFAIEERNTLQARQAKMQDELAKARVIHPDDVPTDSVGIGSRVRLRRVDTGGEVTLSLLGPWDTDLHRRHYSYQTPLAGELLGKAVGDRAALKLEGDPTDYEIAALGVAEL